MSLAMLLVPEEVGDEDKAVVAVETAPFVISTTVVLLMSDKPVTIRIGLSVTTCVELEQSQSVNP